MIKPQVSLLECSAGAWQGRGRCLVHLMKAEGGGRGVNGGIVVRSRRKRAEDEVASASVACGSIDLKKE